MTPDRALGVFAAAIAALALGACGSERHSTRSGEPTSLSPTELRKADCGDWLAGSEGERRAAVRVFGTYFGQSLPQGSPPQTVPEDDAYALLARACSRERSRDLFLWGVYMQAAGFRGDRSANR